MRTDIAARIPGPGRAAWAFRAGRPRRFTGRADDLRVELDSALVVARARVGRGRDGGRPAATSSEEEVTALQHHRTPAFRVGLDPINNHDSRSVML